MVGIVHEFDEKLKLCPFCGEMAWIEHVEFNDCDVWYNPQCSVCLCGWQENYETKIEAIEEWNKNLK
jgi:formate dehydrogenase maturation protein FdhE